MDEKIRKRQPLYFLSVLASVPCVSVDVEGGSCCGGRSCSPPAAAIAAIGVITLDRRLVGFRKGDTWCLDCLKEVTRWDWRRVLDTGVADKKQNNRCSMAARSYRRLQRDCLDRR